MTSPGQTGNRGRWGNGVRAMWIIAGSVFFLIGLAGSVLPLILGLVDLRRRSSGLTALTSLLVLVGGFLVKYVIMAAGQV